MGPQFIAAFPHDPVMWMCVVASIVVGGAVVLNEAIENPAALPPLPGWTLRVSRFVGRWFPRVVMPVLLAISWWMIR